jgi:hypothetical protein
MPTNFSGTLEPVFGAYVKHANTSIESGSFDDTHSVHEVGGAFGTTRGVPRPAVSVSSRGNHGAFTQKLFGSELFDKIIVTPRVKALGFVLSATQFAVEVWNTSAKRLDVLTEIDITGTGGLTLEDDFGEPLTYAAQDSFIYQATVPASGAAQIDNVVSFVFEDDAPGAELDVTGSRITLFSVAPEWSEGIEEITEFLTDVLVKYNDNEQRRALRQIPRRSVSFRALALNARDAAGMESLLWGWQNQPYGVPFWPDAVKLDSDLLAGAFTIPCQTADRLFAAGGLVAIWKDEFTFEALSIQSVAPDGVTVTSPTQLNWGGNPGTRVVPVFLCRLPSKQDVSRHSSFIDQADVAFIPEAGQPAPAPMTSPTQYKGFDVLELAPNWADAPLKRSYARSLVTLDPKIGPIEVIDKGGSAVVTHEFPWWLDGHSNITAFRAFMLRRLGRFAPFWMPTFDNDLVLANDVLSTDSGIRVQSEFYTRFFFPSTARRFVALIPFDGSGNVYRKIVDSHDNGDGTESLQFDSLPGKNFAAATTMVSFLTFGRLADDKFSIKWDTADHAEALLDIQELPREVPS